MPAVTADDLTRMRDNLFFEGPDVQKRLSKFWILLALSAVIASAGVVGDSTATVIGAMIVAPLMTPIMGTVLAIAVGERNNLVRSALMVLGGALVAVALGYVFGLLVPTDIVAETSSQVAGRVNPRLVDLVAALATGLVGAFAQCRADVSDTLPGVAIAISLVPPLVVVGLTLEAGAATEALGALLLFTTNVAAILLAGSVVMVLFGVHRKAAKVAGHELNRRNAWLVVGAMVLVIAVPLVGASTRVATQERNRFLIKDVADDWAEAAGWRLVTVDAQALSYTIRVAGSAPAPDPADLEAALDAEGLGGLDIVVYLNPEDRVDLSEG
jgi:uncharacterized hydrophobic protein (TIGR00271 family)